MAPEPSNETLESLDLNSSADRRHCLLGGFDDIALTLRHADEIRAYEAERLLLNPWLSHRL